MSWYCCLHNSSHEYLEGYKIPQKKEVLEDAKILTASTLLIKVMTRLETTMADAGKTATSLDTNKFDIPFDIMMKAVTQLSGDKKAREYLVDRCNKLIRQKSKYRKVLIELSQKYVAQIKQAALSAAASHFGVWEGLMMEEVLHIMGKINVLEDQTVITEEVSKAIESLRGTKKND